MKVLIVESSPLVASRLLGIVQQVQGLEQVEAAHNLAEARASILCSEPDVVILDVQMSAGASLNLIRSTKQRQPSTVFIVVGDSSIPQYRERSLEVGANFFLDKSLDFNQIPAIIEKLARNGIRL